MQTYKGDLEVVDQNFTTISGHTVILVVDIDGSLIPFMRCNMYSGYYAGGNPVEFKVFTETLYAIPFSLMEGIMKPFSDNK